MDLNVDIVGALAVLVCLGASARLTRLVTQDTFPPVVAVREWWDARTEESGWNSLAHCHWCLAPWVTLVVGVVGWFTGPHWIWWGLTAWLTISYAASWIVHKDED